MVTLLVLGKNTRWLLLLQLVGALAVVGAAAVELPRRVNEFELKHAAVAAIDTSFPGSNGPALLLTAFYPTGNSGGTNNQVVAVPSAGQLITNPAKQADVKTLHTHAGWPNQADAVPDGALRNSSGSGYHFILTASGFFASPSAATGSIDLLAVRQSQEVRETVRTPAEAETQSVGDDALSITLSDPDKGFFYHQANWLDVDGDGTLDIVAARAEKPLLGHAKTNLVWLKQPALARGEMRSLPAGPWVEAQLTQDDGPGVAFELCDIDGDGATEVIAAQYFAKQQLSIWACASVHWSECEDGKDVITTVIDDAGVPFFGVQWVDLNGDGLNDILATTNAANGKGAVLAYEQPQGFAAAHRQLIEAHRKKASLLGQPRDLDALDAQLIDQAEKDVQQAQLQLRVAGNWTKHVLATGYKPIDAFLPGRGAPGKATAFKIQGTDARPAILVSADDAGYVDLLTPHTPGPDSFLYTKNRVVNSTNTVGVPAIGDMDGDGYADFAIPLFAEGKVAMYTFKP